MTRCLVPPGHISAQDLRLQLSQGTDVLEMRVRVFEFTAVDHAGDSGSCISAMRL